MYTNGLLHSAQARWCWTFCSDVKKTTVKPVLVATSIKQATCIKQACSLFPKQANTVKHTCIKQTLVLSKQILIIP